VRIRHRCDALSRLDSLLPPVRRERQQRQFFVGQRRRQGGALALQFGALLGEVIGNGTIAASTGNSRSSGIACVRPDSRGQRSNPVRSYNGCTL
jgi:hypothetical protein